MPLFKERMT